MKIAFAGLGVMGRPMALHLQAAGHQLVVPERKSLTDDVRSVSKVVQDLRTAADEIEVVVSVLPNTPDVESLLFGKNGLAPELKPGTLVIDMSSISPTATRGFAARLEATGCDWIDAPVSGGEIGAKAATLTIMAGGTDIAFTRALPLLRAMGKTITHVGPAGAGQTCKVANQMIVAANIQAVAEALTLVSAAGADPARARQALLGGFASSRVLEVHGTRMIERTFAPGFRIRLHQKDLGLALDAAQEMSIKLPGTALASELFKVCIDAGDADLDHSALITAIETLALSES